MKFRGIIGPRPGSQVPTVDEDSVGGARTTAIDSETGGAKADVSSTVAAGGSGSPSVDEKAPGFAGDGAPQEPQKELQYGVQLAEATLKVWSRNHLIAAYIM